MPLGISRENFLWGHPEISTFSTYEITSCKKGKGVAKNEENLIDQITDLLNTRGRGSKSYGTLSHKAI